MTPQVPAPAGALVARARNLVAKVRPDLLEGRRSLPIRRPAAEIEALWADGQARAAVLDGIPAADASLHVGGPAGEWGTTVSVQLRLGAPAPGMATQALAGKAVRRLKALAETGEVPTTDGNPSARPDPGEPAS